MWILNLKHRRNSLSMVRKNHIALRERICGTTFILELVCEKYYFRNISISTSLCFLLSKLLPKDYGMAKLKTSRASFTRCLFHMPKLFRGQDERKNILKLIVTRWVEM